MDDDVIREKDQLIAEISNSLLDERPLTNLLLIGNSDRLGLFGQLIPLSRLEHGEDIRNHNKCPCYQNSVSWLGLLHLLSSEDNIDGPRYGSRGKVGAAFLELDLLPVLKETALFDELKLALIGALLINATLRLGELKLLLFSQDNRIADLALKVALDELRSNLSGLSDSPFDLDQFSESVCSQSSDVLDLMEVVEGQVEALLVGIAGIGGVDELGGRLGQGCLVFVVLIVDVLAKLNSVQTDQMSEVDVEGRGAVLLEEFDLPVVVPDGLLSVVLLSELLVGVEEVVEELLEV